MKYRIKPTISTLLFQGLFVLALYLLYQPYLIHSDYGISIALTWLLFSMSLNWILPRWTRFIYSSLIVSFFAIGLWMQTVYERAFLQYARLNLLFSLSQEAKQSWQSIQEFIKPEDRRLLIIALIFITLLFILTLLSKKTLQGIGYRIAAIALTIGIAFYVNMGFLQNLEIERSSTDPFLYYKTDHFIYATIPSTPQVVERFGLLGLLQKDVTDLLITPFLTNAFEENQAIGEFLQSQKVSEPNAYTGIFQGKSVLMIEAESLMHLAIHPELTPTLYQLRAEGFNFTGYNSALLASSTADTEFMANTSLMPASDGYGTFMKYALNEYPLTLAKVFSENDYFSLAAHNNYGEFYNRNVVLPALGYDFFDAYRMGFEGQMIPDSDFAEPIKWISYERENFFSFWITFNGHQPYSLSEMNPKFMPYYEQAKELYPELPESDLVYLAKTMDFDRALHSFIIDFTNSGRIDDLVIILYGDHFAKGAFDTDSSLDLFCEDKDTLCRSTPFIVWHHSLDGIEISTRSNALDILPTTLDLMGLDYDQTLALGRSILDPNYEGFYFNAWGDIYVGDLHYNLSSDTLNGIQLNEGETLDPKIIQAIEFIQFAPAIVENNYFATNEWKLVSSSTLD